MGKLCWLYTVSVGAPKQAFSPRNEHLREMVRKISFGEVIFQNETCMQTGAICIMSNSLSYLQRPGRLLHSLVGGMISACRTCEFGAIILIEEARENCEEKLHLSLLR